MSYLRLLSRCGVWLSCFCWSSVVAAAPLLPQDAQGWTVFAPSADSRIVYVSDSLGDDGNSGLSVDQPVKSLGVAKGLIRDGYPDQLLLKRGDTWTNQSFGDWTKRGRSATEPLLIGAYGSGNRPLVQTGKSNGINLWNGSVDTYSNIAIVGIHFQAHANDGVSGPAGINWHRPGQNLLIEDTFVQGYKDNIVVQSVDSTRRMSNLTVRRSIVADAFALNPSYAGGSHAQGIYTDRVDGILVEESVFDHNGWNPSVAGADPTINNHNLYIQTTNTGLTVRDNVIARGSSHGLQARPGGEVSGNLFLDNAIAFFLAGDGGTAADNVVLHGSRRSLYPDGGPRGFGIDMMDVAGSQALRNVIAHALDGANPLDGLVGVTTLDNVIYQWGDTSDAGPFPDPSRTISTYDLTIGGAGSLESFLAGARLLWREDWDASYLAPSAVDYFKEGFAVVPEPSALSVVLLGAGFTLARPKRRL